MTNEELARLYPQLSMTQEQKEAEWNACDCPWKLMKGAVLHAGTCPAVSLNFRMEFLKSQEPKKSVVMIDLKPRPSWDSIWMDFATHLSLRSTCRRASVGCVVVADDNSIVLGLGYNGGPKGLNNDCLSDEPGKCGHLHAEINCLIKTNYRDASPKKVYLTLSPCYNCSVALINAGVQEVIYRDEYRDLTGPALLSQAGIQVRQFPEKRLPERYLHEPENR